MVATRRAAWVAWTSDRPLPELPRGAIRRSVDDRRRSETQSVPKSQHHASPRRPWLRRGSSCVPASSRRRDVIRCGRHDFAPAILGTSYVPRAMAHASDDAPARRWVVALVLAALLTGCGAGASSDRESSRTPRGHQHHDVHPDVGGRRARAGQGRARPARRTPAAARDRGLRARRLRQRLGRHRRQRLQPARRRAAPRRGARDDARGDSRARATTTSWPAPGTTPTPGAR